MAGGGPVVRAEHDDVGLLLLGECAQALAGGRVDDDAAVDVEVAEPAGAALQQGLGLVLLELLAIALDLRRVAHVRERQRGSGLGQYAREHQGVVVVERVVVGNDCCRGHVPLRPCGEIRIVRLFGVSIAPACYQH